MCVCDSWKYSVSYNFSEEIFTQMKFYEDEWMNDDDSYNNIKAVALSIFINSTTLCWLDEWE